MIDGFKERDFGSLEGKTVEEYLELNNPEESVGYEKNEALERRVMKSFYSLLETKENTLITAHAHVLKAILVNVDASYDYSFMLKNCAILCIELKENQLILNKIRYIQCNQLCFNFISK